MQITGDTLVRVLSRPEWDDSVREVLEALGLGRIEMSGEFFSEDFYVEKYDLSLEFSYVCATPQQYERSEINDAYLNQVSFKKNCSIPLPFGLKKGDSYDVCIEKIKLHTHPLKCFRAHPLIVMLQLEDVEKQYFFVMSFSKDEHRGLEKIVMYPVNIKGDYSSFQQYEVAV